MNAPSADTKVVLLVGGLGTRLRSVVPDTAKPMACVGDRPFLELLLLQLRSQDFRRLVLCTGFRSRDVETRFGRGNQWHLEIEYSSEPSPLGTAGALKFAETLLRSSDDFIVMNGDSFMDIDLQGLLVAHRNFQGIATLAVTYQQSQMRYGTVLIAPESRVSGFIEKNVVASSGFVNAGIYVFSSHIFDFIPSGPSSLERDVFPKILSHGVYAVEQRGIFIDIGTPEDYARAQELGEQLYLAASSSPARRVPGGES
jgi:D-glycero-alpha-D-manno-heptose 1-phosphate guanylyltransferase